MSHLLTWRRRGPQSQHYKRRGAESVDLKQVVVFKRFNREEEHENNEVSDAIFTSMSRKKEAKWAGECEHNFLNVLPSDSHTCCLHPSADHMTLSLSVHTWWQTWFHSGSQRQMWTAGLEQRHFKGLINRVNSQFHFLSSSHLFIKCLITERVFTIIRYSHLCVCVCVCVCVFLEQTGLSWFLWAHSVFPLRLKMSGYEEEDTAESAGFSCVSLKSDWSMGHPISFSKEPGPSHTE